MSQLKNGFSTIYCSGMEVCVVEKLVRKNSSVPMLILYRCGCSEMYQEQPISDIPLCVHCKDVPSVEYNGANAVFNRLLLMLRYLKDGSTLEIKQQLIESDFLVVDIYAICYGFENLFHAFGGDIIIPVRKCLLNAKINNALEENKMVEGVAIDFNILLFLITRLF